MSILAFLIVKVFIDILLKVYIEVWLLPLKIMAPSVSGSGCTLLSVDSASNNDTHNVIAAIYKKRVKIKIRNRYQMFNNNEK